MRHQLFFSRQDIKIAAVLTKQILRTDRFMLGHIVIGVRIEAQHIAAFGIADQCAEFLRKMLCVLRGARQILILFLTEPIQRVV